MKQLSPEIVSRLSKVPEVTIFFWIIKILCTTVWETFADFLNMSLWLGLIWTSVIMAILLLIALYFQLKSTKYIPSIYWLSVVLISVVGTLITDNLTDNFGIPLVMTTIVFSIALIVMFIAWYMKEGSLSIHSITTCRRELFYWWVILCTFALGTAAGDLIAEWLGLWYALSAVMFGWVIVLIYLLFRYFKLNDIVAFWIAYILTRPLGASIGDLLSQPTHNGWRWLGTIGTSVLFLVAIAGLTWYMSRQQHDTLS